MTGVILRMNGVIVRVTAVIARGNNPNALRGLGALYRLSVTSPTRLKPASLRIASTSETRS